MPNKDICKRLFRVSFLVFVMVVSPAWGASFQDKNPLPDQNGHVKAAGPPPLVLDELINEALAKNPQLAAYGFLVSAREHRVPQERSLPDPMVAVGYQNEGWDRYSYGDTVMSQWMFSVSQTFPYPGKLGLKGEIASRDAQYARESYDDLKLKIVQQVKDLYYDLLLYYKDLDIIKQRYGLFTQLEKAALARYSSGLAPQEEVILAQTGKYTLLEKREEAKQKIIAACARLNSITGRPAATPLGRPVETGFLLNASTAAPLVGAAISNSPQIKAEQRLVEEAGAGVRLAEKQYYPDFTVTGAVDKKGGPFQDDWSLVTAVNVPLYYRTKQREGVLEAKALLEKAQADLEDAKLSLSSDVETDFSLAGMATHHMKLYKGGLIPKTYEGFEASLSGYVAGNVPALNVIDSLRSLLDYEFKYWKQYTEEQKAIAGIEALTGKTLYITEGK